MWSGFLADFVFWHLQYVHCIIHHCKKNCFLWQSDNRVTLYISRKCEKHITHLNQILLFVPKPFIMRTLPFHRWCFLDKCMNFLQVGVCEDFEGSCTVFPPFQLQGYNRKWSSHSIEMVIIFSSSLQWVSLVPLQNFQSL